MTAAEKLKAALKYADACTTTNAAVVAAAIKATADADAAVAEAINAAADAAEVTNKIADAYRGKGYYDN